MRVRDDRREHPEQKLIQPHLCEHVLRLGPRRMRAAHAWTAEISSTILPAACRTLAPIGPMGSIRLSRDNRLEGSPSTAPSIDRFYGRQRELLGATRRRSAASNTGCCFEAQGSSKARYSGALSLGRSASVNARRTQANPGANNTAQVEDVGMEPDVLLGCRPERVDEEEGRHAGAPPQDGDTM